jgi:hypothetical protein
MWQYAFGVSLSVLREEEVYFDRSSFTNDPLRHYELGAYALPIDFADLEPPYYQEPDLLYHPEVRNVPRGTSFIGYWQTERYFDRDLVLASFATPRGKPNPQCEEMAHRIITCPNSCFVGVRRADYLWAERINYHGVLPLRYYTEASKLIPYDAKYFVFTDDIPWSKENFHYDWEVVEVNNKDEKAWDIWLMSLCTHAIIANSSFHWFGAFLGADQRQGTIVAPKLWYVNGLANETVPGRWLKV